MKLSLTEELHLALKDIVRILNVAEMSGNDSTPQTHLPPPSGSFEGKLLVCFEGLQSLPIQRVFRYAVLLPNALAALHEMETAVNNEAHSCIKALWRRSKATLDCPYVELA